MSDSDMDRPLIAADEALDRIERIRYSIETMREDLAALYLGRAWITLDLPNWDALCDHYFDGVRIALPRDQRREVVADLTESGLSSRAIGSALGVDKDTVVRDRKAPGVNTPPAKNTTVTGLDGKSYRPTKPRQEAIEPEPAEPVMWRVPRLGEVVVANESTKPLASVIAVANCYDDHFPKDGPFGPEINANIIHNLRLAGDAIANLIAAITADPNCAISEQASKQPTRPIRSDPQCEPTRPPSAARNPTVRRSVIGN